MNKKAGDEKYYIIISLIIGLMILAIALFFMFREYFSDDEMSLETCKQSLILRSGNLINGAKMLQESMVEFKCKTIVVNIKLSDKPAMAGKFWVEQKIADTMKFCFDFYAKRQLFSENFWSSNTDEVACFHCARIHVDDDVIEDLKKTPTKMAGASAVLELNEYLSYQMPNSQETYKKYFYNVDNPAGDTTKQLNFKTVSFINQDFPSIIDLGRGDIIISVIYYNPGLFDIFGERKSTIFPWQPLIADLKCTALLTVPA